jgi:hypothetical protein
MKNAPTAADHAGDVRHVCSIKRLPPTSAGRLIGNVNKWWGQSGVALTYSFMDNASQALIKRCDAAFNSWAKYGNAHAAWVQNPNDAQVRITRVDTDGYYSFLGKDILHIPVSQNTMNLGGFTDKTSDAEIIRVATHEWGHSLGFEHEQILPAEQAKLVKAKVEALYMRTQGWSRAEVDAQIFPGTNVAELIGDLTGDDISIMMYPFPGSVTKDGKPIQGGVVLSAGHRHGRQALSIAVVAAASADRPAAGRQVFHRAHDAGRHAA